jgi:P27 family predicted phage terminase small subunit
MSRHPIPTRLLELEKGKLYDEQRDRGKLEPKPLKELIPRCPKRLSKEERKEWKYFAAILKNYGLFTIANSPMLDLLATNSAQYKDCAEKVSKTGIIIKGPLGNPMYNPYWNAVNKLEDKIMRILTDLGMSSSGLAKIGSLMLKKKKEKDEFFED